MGRQINFYMLPEDETEFIKFVKSIGNIEIHAYRSREIPFRSLKQLPKPFSVDFWGTVYLYNKAIGIVEYHYVEKQKHYYISNDKSTVIEFSRSGLNDKNQLLEGRIWIATNYVVKDSSEELVWKQKPKEFIEWYEKITRWLRKNYLKYGSIYISKRVLEWLKQGGKLSVSGHIVDYNTVKGWRNK